MYTGNNYKGKLHQEFEKYNIETITKCHCGAYTVEINGENYSVSEENFFKFFPAIDQKLFKRSIKKVLMNQFSGCNHCVNHWGLDLCACGSGESPDQCENNFDECGKPMQIIDKYDHVCGGRSWI